MISVLEEIPPGFLSLSARELYRILKGPTLIHLPGRREPALFVSILLHGNEETGFSAVQRLLQKYQGQTLPRAFSIFVGNVEAARYGIRRFDYQQDYNRVWLPGRTPEHAMTAQVIDTMRRRGVFASVDIHNNTGVNPHYACVNRLDHRFFQLATLFGRTVVYFVRPLGVQTAAFADLCPSVTIECGQPGDERGIEHAREYLEACLHLFEMPNHPVPEHDIDLFHTVVTVKVPAHLSFGFGEETADICLIDSLDHLNFTELITGTLLGSMKAGEEARLHVFDELGHEVGGEYFEYSHHEIRTKKKVMPSMFTLNKQVIRQDCLGYLMERLSLPVAGSQVTNEDAHDSIAKYEDSPGARLIPPNKAGR